MIDNFLFQVDYYLDLQNIVEEDLKIKTVAMLLEGDVVAWWRWKMLDIENGHCTITTFDVFRKQLKGYFMPVNAERHVYRLVANLKQTGALRDYIRSYQKVMLDVPMMTEKDKLHWFIIGLQSWAQADVERSNPETLEQAYVAAERLADTQRTSCTDTFRSMKDSDHSGKREERCDNRNESSTQKPVERKPFFHRDNNGPPREVNC
uniref:Ty3 transposon capsid-like protein domain-containing protein n=2 Tax=Nymphaea colorata TaxID=210225 RepID=A0A5K1DQJ1_9MAGN